MNINKLPLWMLKGLLVVSLSVMGGILLSIKEYNKVAHNNKTLLVPKGANISEIKPLINKNDNWQDTYLVSCYSEVVDKKGKWIDNQMLMAVKKLNNKKESTEVTFVRLEAVSDTAKEEINKENTIFPELVYSSVQYVANSIADLEKVKNPVSFNVAFKKYKHNLNEANDWVALHGYQIVEDSFAMKGGKVVQID